MTNTDADGTSTLPSPIINQHVVPALAPPPNTMNTTITAGPIATAASVDGATEPTASPRAADVKDSSVRMPRNDANLHSTVAQLTTHGVLMHPPAAAAHDCAMKVRHGHGEEKVSLQSSTIHARFTPQCTHIACLQHRLWLGRAAHRLALGFRPVMGYTRLPNSSGKSAPTGNSAISLRSKPLP